MSPNDADGMANSVDPDQTAPLGAVWSGSALFAQAYLSENLGSLRYFINYCMMLFLWALILLKFKIWPYYSFEGDSFIMVCLIFGMYGGFAL